NGLAARREPVSSLIPRRATSRPGGEAIMGRRAFRRPALGLAVVVLLFAAGTPPPLVEGAAAPLVVARPAAGAGASADGAAQLVPLRFGSPQSISDAGIFIGRDRGYYREVGFDVDVIPFQSGPNTIAPLASGELEAAGGTISIAMLNAIDRGIGIKAVSDKGI